MRTTINIDEVLFKRLRQIAVGQSQTISQFLNSLLAQCLQPKKEKEKFHLNWKVVEGKELPAVDPADRDQLYDYLGNRH